LKKVGPADAVYDFVACDASLISEAHKCATQWAANHDRLDFLVMSQGVGSTAVRCDTIFAYICSIYLVSSVICYIFLSFICFFFKCFEHK
jgi:hypothetical protein